MQPVFNKDKATAKHCPFSCKQSGWLNVLAWMFAPQRILKRWQQRPVLDIASWFPVYLVGDPEQIKEINRGTGKTFLGGPGNEFLKPLLGPQSVFLVEGEQHRLARNLIGKALHSDIMRQRQPEIRMLMNACVADAMGKGRIELTQAMRWLAFQLVARFAFADNNPTTLRVLFNRFESATGITGNLVVYNRGFWKARGLLSIGHFVEKIARDVDVEMYRILAQERAKQQATDACRHAPNLLSLMLDEQAQHGYDDGFIRDTLVSVMAAGYDTTGAALGWLCYWLAQQPPEAMQAMQHEANQPNTDLRPHFNAFINETLRYCSPIEILPRKISADGLAEASRILGASTAATLQKREGLVSPCPYAVHHNPEVYPQPEHFDPERFLQKNYKSHEFLPFGGGHRFCVGHTLGRAILETFLLALLSQNKTLRLVRGIPFRPVRRGVSLWPAYRMMASVVPLPIQTQHKDVHENMHEDAA